MIRKLVLAAAALAVLVLVTAATAVMLFAGSADDFLFEAGPTSARFVDIPMGVVDPKSLDLRGDLLLTSRHETGLFVRPLATPSNEPVRLFRAVFVANVGPDGRHVIAWTGRKWRVVRLADLRAVAEVEGADPLFLGSDRVLALFRGDGCTRRDATVLSLRDRTQQDIKLAGDEAGLSPVAVEGQEVIAQRLAKADSGCGAAGFARVDLSTGAVTTITKSGGVIGVASGHVWLSDGNQTKVFDRQREVATSTPRVAAEPVGNGGVVYVDDHLFGRGSPGPAQPPTPLRLGRGEGPRPEDAAGDRLVEPEELTAVLGGTSVLVAHRGGDLPGGGHATVLSLCSAHELHCRELVDVTWDYPRVLGVVPAEVFAG